MLEGITVSFVLSQFFGLYLAIKAFTMFNRAKIYRRQIKQADPESPLIVLAATIGMVFGLIVVGVHNRWVFSPIILITVISWFVLVLSLLWLSVPEKMMVWTKKLYAGKGYYGMICIMAVVGLFILARGVYVFATGQERFTLFLHLQQLLDIIKR